MPFTLSHPAAVLPFRRLSPGHFEFSALVIGSLTPDFGYYVHRFDIASFGHSLIGSVLICLPTGVLLLLIFHLTRRAVCFLLPSPHRQALTPLCSISRSINFKRLGMILLCLLIGAWSHVLWDSFTHVNGWFVQRIGWLQQTIFVVGTTGFPAYYLLQQVSSIAGAGILVIAYLFWLRRHETIRPAESDTEVWRYAAWIAIIAISLLVAVPIATQKSQSFIGYAAFRVFVFQAGVHFISTGLSLIIIISGIVYARRETT